MKNKIIEMFDTLCLPFGGGFQKKTQKIIKQIKGKI